MPGHERFVRTMLAGAGGIDLALLVVAADEGVMPQTREHLDICRLLGFRAGWWPWRECNLVDAAWLALVEEDVRKGGPAAPSWKGAVDSRLFRRRPAPGMDAHHPASRPTGRAGARCDR